MEIITCASLLACDLADIKTEARRCKAAGVDRLHYDVMDGSFVEQISYGTPVLKSLRAATDMFLDAHLMVRDALTQARLFAAAGADSVTVHIESDGAREALSAIKQAGIRAAAAIKPATPASTVYDVLSLCDMVLVMTVEPGRGGQSFMTDMLGKIRELREYADAHGFPALEIQVDGGINKDTAALAAEAGANVLVAGTGLFKADDMAAANAELKSVRFYKNKGE